MAANQHIDDYLAFYAAFPQPPRFAVMLDGRWGIGKTHLLTKFLERVKTPDYKPVYVSLNGLKSSEEIDKALFKAMHAVLGNKFFGAALSLGRSGMKALQGVSVDVDLLDLVNRYTADLYVFDDLERCEMPIGQVLGYINAFVEHGKRKVIVVANKDEIVDKEAYARTREKLIGMTLVFQSAIDDAIAAFFDSIRDRAARDFLLSKAELVRSLHSQAGLDNLRILQQALWDFERFFTALENRHRANDTAMSALLRLLLALSMEVRAGRLFESDLQDRRGSHVAALLGRSETPPSRYRAAMTRYAGVNLENTALSDEALVRLLIQGGVDAQTIRRDLDASSYFVVVDDEPSWRTVWHGLERSDEEVAAAFDDMETKFAARAYVVPGEILHVFGLRLQFAQIGALPATVDEVVAACEQYVDDLYAQGNLVPPPSEDDVPEMRATGYGGLGIVSAGTPEHRRLFAYLRAKLARATADAYPAIASELIQTLADEPERFMDRISTARRRSGGLARTPVLAMLDPDTFVSAVLALNPAAQRDVLLSLKTRYEHRILAGELAAERSWALSVSEKFEAAKAAMAPYAQYRLGLFLEQSFGEVPELAAPPAPAPVVEAGPTDEA